MAAPTVNLTFPKGHVIDKVSFPGGLFINNESVASLDGKTFETVNPATGKVIAAVAEAGPKDIDRAVEAAQKAFETVWGENTPGHARGRLLMKLADAIEANADTIASIESLDNGKAYGFARGFDISEAAACLRYYGGWADKEYGQTIEVDNSKFVYTRHEPIGVVGQIIPWNFPFLMMAWKLGPALATGNTIVLKTSETTPLSALYFTTLAKDILPPGVLNIVSGFGAVAGAAMSSHPHIEKIAFTGSTLVGRTIMKAAASSNLKKVTLELGGKSPNIIFDDADIEAAVGWSAFGLFFNHGQCCCAGSRVYVQEGIYDKFIAAFQAKVEALKVGDPFSADTFQGPQNSKLQFDRIMAHIKTGTEDGATLLRGGKQFGTEGYFIEPTIFTDVNPNARIAREEIFGPVVVVSKFKDEAEILKIANDSVYGLAAAVFSRDISRAHNVAHKLKAGTVWINCYNQLHSQVPFGGFKQSGIGRELGQYALHNYTAVKAVNLNLNAPSPI